ncbi:MAG: ATP-dependent RNA helicase HrpA [Deltaproteobacteria bacterium]|nr:ATP-dependent RNA helicase HrpA [Deltaproteobacteria bacterium]
MSKMLQKMESLLPKALISDRHKIGIEIARIKRSKTKTPPDEKINKRLILLEKKLQRSIKKKSWRKINRPDPIYNDALPILSKKDEIIDSISNHPVVIISGETGSGKTTQIPKFCLAAGCGIDGKIGCTQPRRIAAMTVSKRIAEEFGESLGKSVGYKIRFKDKTSPNTFIKIMTDGILLAETQNDPFLNEYDTIIVDEAHERSLNIDFILGILKTLLKKRKDLKIVITSATIDTEKFSKAFDHAPVIEVSGRMYPVDVRYLLMDSKSGNDDEQTHVDMAVYAVDRLFKETDSGDMLVFMPTEQDIRETCELLKEKNDTNATILPLFARLSASEQSRVFSPSLGRKIIVATNIAETSITIPGIKYVIDTGLARISRYSPRSRITSLPVTAISKSSANQRKGRCGRIENGVCIRLFSEEDFENRPLFTSPEILRANLAEVILRMISLKLGDISSFPFIDKPALKSIQDGFDLLYELGAIVLESSPKKKNKQRFSLTKKGRLMAKMPVDPRLSRMLIEAQTEGCLETLMVIASALSIQDPRERPAEKAQEADQAQKIFCDPSSDFITLLNIWNKYHEVSKKEKTTGRIKKFCKTHYLSFKRMREWRDIHGQLSVVLKEHGLDDKNKSVMDSRITKRALPKRQTRKNTAPTAEFSDLYAAVHKSLLSGLLSNIALKKEKNIFQATKGKEVMIFPGSSLFNTAKEWIVAAELVETSRLFARTCANIDNMWLEELGGNLCKYTYLHPHWERKRGEVVAYEQVSLFGLIIIPKRMVSYGNIHPDHATEIFIQSALVEGDVREKLPFMLHNQNLIDSVKDMEDRIRRRDILVDEADLFDFYIKRLKRCYDIRTLKTYIRQDKNDHFLRMKSEDITRYDPDEKELSLFPDRIDIGNLQLDCTYRFKPGTSDDGVTVNIPASMVSAVPSESLEWLVPGLYREKITTLIKGLPKAFRKKLLPVANTVDIIVSEMPKTKTTLITALGNFIYTRFGIDIPSSAWPNDILPDYLKMRISMTDAKGKELFSCRDPKLLSRHMSKKAERVESAEMVAAKKYWERTHITCWDFPDLPEHIHLKGKNMAQWMVYPGLQNVDPTEKSVNLRLFQSSEKAIKSHKEGVAILFTLYFSKDLKFLKKNLKLPKNMEKQVNYFGGSALFEKRIYERIIKKLFFKNIRSKDAFFAHADSIAQSILSEGRELLNHSLPVLEAYHETRTTIYALETAHNTNKTALQFLKGLRTELSKLVPETFVDLYDVDRFIHLVRYMKALEIRAHRAVVDFEKDRAKSDEIGIFTESLDGLLKGLSPTTSKEKRTAIEAYFWLIEEYKVSLFAQELKTSIPVSKKRLIETLKEIERMN